MNQVASPLDAASRAVGIAVEPDWSADILANLSVLLRFGNDVAGFGLPDELEPAPVYRAIG